MTTPSLDTLTAETDINGAAIAVGARVRSFDFPLLTDSGVLGLELEGERAAYMEGVVEAIGEDYVEGCNRYRILVDRIVFGGAERPIEVQPGERPVIYPPLNGTPTLGSKCFGVVAV